MDRGHDIDLLCLFFDLFSQDNKGTFKRLGPTGFQYSLYNGSMRW